MLKKLKRKIVRDEIDLEDIVKENFIHCSIGLDKFDLCSTDDLILLLQEYREEGYVNFSYIEPDYTLSTGRVTFYNDRPETDDEYKIRTEWYKNELRFLKDDKEIAEFHAKQEYEEDC